MQTIKALFIFLFIYAFSACTSKKIEEKGFQVSQTTLEENDTTNSIHGDSLHMMTQPNGVLLTGIANIRLTSIYKVNKKKNNSSFIGSNQFRYSYEEEEVDENNWHSNIIPGFEAVYGYNLVNIAHYNIQENKQKLFFAKPVLIKTLYYPSFKTDTLNYKPVARNYFLVTVYNEDTNKDGFINLVDLRRMFLFDSTGTQQKVIIPENYSVFKSEYDPANDFMYVYTKLDSNKNGIAEESEPQHVFWVDLKDPNKSNMMY